MPEAATTAAATAALSPTAAVATPRPATLTPPPTPTVPPTDMPAEEAEMYLTSSTFGLGELIPVKYTCDGEDLSPPLEWGASPEGTRAFVLIADDPDAPGGTWVHWVLYDLPGDTRALPEGNPESLGVAGLNDFRRAAYGGPCPPVGNPHRYFFTLYAVDVPSLGLPQGASRGAVEAAMQGHILAQAQWMGIYRR